MNIEFVNQYLSNIKWDLDNPQWQVSGIIDRISNEYLKFDIRFLNDFNDKKGKLINSQSKADKVLFEDDQNWILVDTEELRKHMINNKLKEVKLEDLLSKLEWNIILPKN